MKKLGIFCICLAFCKVSHAELIQQDCPPPLECTVEWMDGDAAIPRPEPLRAPTKAVLPPAKKPIKLPEPGKSIMVRGNDAIELKDLARTTIAELPPPAPASKRLELSPRESHIHPRRAVVESGRRFSEDASEI